MQPSLKSKCLDILRSGVLDREEVESLALALPDQEMANHIRVFSETGDTRPYGAIWGEDGVRLLGVQYVIVRVLPKSFAVMFACACGRQVIPYIQDAYPAETFPADLLSLAESWVSGSVTKKKLREEYVKLQDFGSRIDDQWHRSFGSGEFEHLSRAEVFLTELPIVAIDVVGYAVQSVGLSKKKTAWLTSIDLTASSHIDVETIANGKRRRQPAKKWQLEKLSKLILSEGET